MSAIASYRALLRIVGPAYIVVAFLGRIPLAMSQLGVLVLVSTTTGSYGLGGAAAGVLAIANAIGSPLAGALADRIGQRPVVLVQSLVGAAGLAGIVIVTTDRFGSMPAILAMAAITGFAMPQVGPLARVRWRPITADEGDQRRLVDAAFSYEGAADEASFVLGPATIGVLALIAEPAGALLAAAVLLAVFGSWFAIHPTSALAHQSDTGERGTGRLWTIVFIVLVLAQLCIGIVFGSVQTGSTVLATAEGQAGLAGLIHATLGIGSVIAGLAITALPERILYATRMLVAALALLVLSAPLLLVDSIASLVGVIALLGFAVAPYMISNFALAGILVPLHRVGTAMTLLAGATGIGYAVGASIAGRLADDHSHTAAFAVTVSAAGLAVLLAVTANRALRNAIPVNV